MLVLSVFLAACSGKDDAKKMKARKIDGNKADEKEDEDEEVAEEDELDFPLRRI